MSQPTVYLAGPMVFAPEPETLFAQMKAICAGYGLSGIAPLDNQVGLEGLAPGHALADAIVRADIALMQRLDAGLFCLDPVRRGVEMDAGTAYEVGYMSALGKPLMGWTIDGRDFPAKIAAHFADALMQAGTNATGGMSGSLRDPDGVLLHSQGCVQNAMVHIGIEHAGGAVYAHPDWQIAFTQAVAHLARQLRE